ncbi:MAG: hypothetical protein ACTSRG_04485 [Candidatus Helarchaeota archaeon]
MPKGFVILEWTMEDGLVILKKFPEKLKVNIDDMMRVFYAHITGTGEGGNVVMRLEKAQVNISSYFTGMESEVPYMINLILELGEDQEMFGGVIKEINSNIINYLQIMKTSPARQLKVIKEFNEYLAKMFDYIQRLSNLTKEQKVAQIFCNPKARQIHKRLQQGPISKKGLKLYLEKELNQVISNLELTLDPFTETEIIKEDWIKGYRDQYLFLLHDFSVMRAPATKIIESVKKNRPSEAVAKEYLKRVKTFFSKYKPTFEDNLKIASTLMDPDKYDVLRLFSFNFHNFKKIPTGYGGEETRKIIKELLDEQILTKITEGKTEWIFLLSDISIDVFFPEYLLEKIRREFKDGVLKKEVAIKHLELLEKAYVKS